VVGIVIEQRNGRNRVVLAKVVRVERADRGTVGRAVDDRWTAAPARQRLHSTEHLLPDLRNVRHVTGDVVGLHQPDLEWAPPIIGHAEIKARGVVRLTQDVVLYMLGVVVETRRADQARVVNQ
jgi:hypothetical protein